MFTIQDDWGFFLGLFVGSIGFLFLLVGSSLRAMGDDDDGFGTFGLTHDTLIGRAVNGQARY